MSRTYDVDIFDEFAEKVQTQLIDLSNMVHQVEKKPVRNRVKRKLMEATTTDSENSVPITGDLTEGPAPKVMRMSNISRDEEVQIWSPEPEIYQHAHPIKIEVIDEEMDAQEERACMDYQYPQHTEERTYSQTVHNDTANEVPQYAPIPMPNGPHQAGIPVSFPAANEVPQYAPIPMPNGPHQAGNRNFPANSIYNYMQPLREFVQKKALGNVQEGYQPQQFADGRFYPQTIFTNPANEGPTYAPVTNENLPTANPEDYQYQQYPDGRFYQQQPNLNESANEEVPPPDPNPIPEGVNLLEDYNCRLTVDHLNPIGGDQRLGAFTISFDTFNIKITGNISIENDVGNMEFERYFLPNYTYSRYGRCAYHLTEGLYIPGSNSENNNAAYQREAEFQQEQEEASAIQEPDHDPKHSVQIIQRWERYTVETLIRELQ